MKFEEQYQDVLQNLEYAIIMVYREQPELIDFDVLEALEALRRHYIREVRKQPAKEAILPQRPKQVFHAMKQISEWRLGRSDLEKVSETSGTEVWSAREHPITLDELVQCIKRLEKSAKFWNKNGGRQGYLTYIDQFLI